MVFIYINLNSPNSYLNQKFLRFIKVPSTSTPFRERKNVTNCLLLFEDYVLDTEFLAKNKKKLNDVLRGYNGGKAVNLPQNVPSLPPCSAMRIHSPSGKNISPSNLRAAISKDGERFPSAVHFVLPFRDPNLTYIHHISILGAFWMLRPARLILWYARPPQGKYWEKVKKNFTESGVFEDRVVMIYREAPKEIYNIKMNVIEHQSDIMRMDALLLFGGLYLDMDVFVLKPLETIIRASGQKTFVIGRETGYGLCNGVMLSAPSSKFMLLWHLAYQTLNDGQWAVHSVLLPHTMQKAWPELVHVEEKSMDRPNWTPEERKLIHNARNKGQPPVWRWWDINFCVHLWIRSYPGDINAFAKRVKIEDSMLAEMIRWIMYGQKPPHSQMAVTSNKTKSL